MHPQCLAVDVKGANRCACFRAQMIHPGNCHGGHLEILETGYKTGPSATVFFLEILVVSQTSLPTLFPRVFSFPLSFSFFFFFSFFLWVVSSSYFHFPFWVLGILGLGKYICGGS